MFAPFTPGFFRRLQQLKIHTRRAYLGSRQGIHLSSRRGHGLEFSDFRSYTPGDDFRHIDWGAYGRTDRLYVKQFREEQDLNVSVLLDCSASMAYPQEEKKFEMARDLALALGYIALTDGDRVRFSLLGQGVTPPYRGARAVTRAAKELHSVKPQGTFDFPNAVREGLASQKIPGKCFLISDFMFEDQQQIGALDYIRSRNFDISVIQVLAPSELSLDPNLGSTFVMDAETSDVIELALNQASRKEYALQLAAHIHKLEKFCQRAKIAHVLVSSEESVMDVVLRRLPALGVLV